MRLILAMRAGIDWMGGVEYIKNLVLAVGSLPETRAGEVEINLLANRASPASTLEFLRPHVRNIYMAEEALRPATYVNRGKWKLARIFLKAQDWRSESFFRREGLNFAYPHIGTGRVGGGFNSAAWIPDFQHRALHQYFSPQEGRERDQHFATIAAHAPLIVLSSKCAHGDFTNLFPHAASRARVMQFRTVPQQAWYDGAMDSVLRRYNLPDKFFLVSNQFWKHKNHLAIFAALASLQKMGCLPKVVCTGLLHDYRDAPYGSSLLQKIHTSGLASQVFFLGLIPREDQIQLMRQCVSVIQPSYFEGWSTVVEDVRCLGKPLLLSDIPVHREQAPPHARYFEPSSAEALAELMAEAWASTEPGYSGILEDEARREQLAHVRVFAESFLRIAAERP